MTAPFRLRQHRRRFGWWLQRSRLAQIQAVVLDVDGVLTDGGLWYGPQGELLKRFDVRDGLGIRLLQHAGLEVALLSGGRGGATEARAAHLGIRHCLVGAKDKLVALEELSQRLRVARSAMLFVGDDLNDLALQREVGLLVSTGDGAPALRRRADAVLLSDGGRGAVRELAERLLQSRGAWRALSRQGWSDRND
jgi:3-deoxy-D-manno-octulosonate 8-phosphate phosphatase (KDO 8-P phosphatase)